MPKKKSHIILCPTCKGDGTVETDRVSHKPRINPTHRAQAISLRESGLTIRAIAEKLGYKNPGSITNLLNPKKTKSMQHLTIKEAIEQGFTHYGDGDEGIWDLFPNTELDPALTYLLFDKKEKHPSLSGPELLDIIKTDMQQCSPFTDDEDQIGDAVDNAAVDWEDLANRLNTSLTAVIYYETTDIKLIP